ncbi:MAG: PAS domain S-box protein [Candidatus Thorarchaeota archaeon]
MKESTKHLKFETKFKNIDNLWQIALDAMNDAVFLIDNSKKILKCNKAILNFLGKSSYDEIIGYSCAELIHSTEEQIDWCPLRKMWETQRRESTTQKLNNKWVEISVEPIFDANGEVIGAVHIISDISVQKKAEEAQKESEQQYLTILNSLNDAMHVIDRDLKIVFQNPAMNQWLTKLKLKSENIGKNILEAFPFLNYEKVRKEYEQVFKEGELLITREATRLLDRNVFTETLKIPIISEGEVNFIITILRDSTDNEEAKEKLRASEKKYRYLIENALEGVWVIDSKANTILVNPAMANILGYSADEMIGKSLYSFLDETQKEITKTHLKKRKKGIAEERDAEFLHRNGNKVYLRIRATPIFDKNGEYEGTFAFLADISQRKIVEQKLKDSEEKFRKIFESIPIGMTLYEYQPDEKLIVREHNPAAEKILKVDKSQFLNKTIEEVFPSLIETDIPDRYKMLAKEGGTCKWDEFVYEDDKIQGAYEVVAFQTTPGFMATSFNDITKRIIAEKMIKESEEKYRLISENTDDLIVVYDENRKVEYLNAESHSRVLGYDSNKFFNKSFRDSLVHQNDKEMADKSAIEGLDRGIFQYQFRLKHKNQNYLWFEVTGKIFLDSYGNEKILCVSRNINDIKVAEEKIIESEENFRTMAEQAFIGMLIIQDDIVVYINKALLQIFDFTLEEVKGWKKSQLIKQIFPEDLQYLREYRKRLRNEELDLKPYYSYRVFTKYGNIKWIDQFSRPIIYRGKPAELVTIMDITEKKKAEEELRKLNSLKSELLRRTSHELKTPLVSIKGFSDLLLTVHKEKLDDNVLATIHEIKLGCERLENLIKDILKTAELESESIELNKHEEDLSFLIKLCVRELQGLIKLRNHEIVLNIHDKLITSFESERIHLVISNLLNNAIKYTPPNGKIEINSAITDYNILISIKDNGIGLTSEEKRRLFTQFGKIERYGQGLDIISDGSGLGLYITKKIIVLHGGRIGVRSKGRHKGSTFYFTLPLITKDKN